MNKYTILFCALLAGCSIGDENHTFSDNNDSTINVDNGGECYSCIEAATEFERIVSDDEICTDKSLNDLQSLKDCADIIPVCQKWAKDEEPMNENCFNIMFGTKQCNPYVIFCAAE